MSPFRFSGIIARAALCALVSLSACNGVATVKPISPQAAQVLVEESDPPAGATPLGELKVTHGEGCSFTGDRGTREGATALLREAAMQRGANFVKVTKVVEPHSGHDCYHREFVMQGLSFRLAGTPNAVPLAAPAAAAAGSSAPPAPASTAGAVPATTLDCTPPCSPGYACEAGICRALCNPACSTGQVCRADRVCVPATP